MRKTVYDVVDSDGESWFITEDPEEARTKAYDLECEYDEPFHVHKVTQK